MLAFNVDEIDTCTMILRIRASVTKPELVVAFEDGWTKLCHFSIPSVKIYEEKINM